MLAKSIKWKLISTLIASQLLLAVRLVWMGVYFTRRQLRSAFDAGLRSRAMSVAALVRYSEEPSSTLIFVRDLVPASVNERHHDLFEVRSSDDHVIARSPSWPEGLERQVLKKQQHWNFGVGSLPNRAIRLDNLPVGTAW